MSFQYLTKNSVSFLPAEAPILSLKGVTLTPICICPECGASSRTPWSKTRGRLRDWAAFLEEVKYITCSNDSCTSRFSQAYYFESPKGVSILNKASALNEMVSWFETASGQSLTLTDENEEILWDPFFQAIPDWADHIPISLFTNILHYTPPTDLEGLLLGRKGLFVFGDAKCVRSSG